MSPDQPSKRKTAPGAAAEPSSVTAPRVPVPPAHLRFLVAGTTDEPWFVEGGRLGLLCLEELLAKNGVSLRSLDGVLDFGCGCGRVLRYWQETGAEGLRGCDYNPDLIGWCQENINFAQTFVNKFSPPLDLPDASLDLAYAFSVFTHLDEAMQFAWMREMGRVLRPNGLLVVTTHGASYLNELSAYEQGLFSGGMLVVRYSEDAGTNTCGAFHPVPFLRNVQAPAGGFAVEDFIPQGAKGNPHQDIYLLRRLTLAEGCDHFRAAGRLFSDWFVEVRRRLPGTAGFGCRSSPHENEAAQVNRSLYHQQQNPDAVRGSALWRVGQAIRGFLGRH